MAVRLFYRRSKKKRTDTDLKQLSFANIRVKGNMAPSSGARFYVSQRKPNTGYTGHWNSALVHDGYGMYIRVVSNTFSHTKRQRRIKANFTQKKHDILYCTPFLLFDGNCAEAMTFYKNCLGGELMLTKTGDTPMKDQFPPEKHNKIINAHLKSGALEFSATDWHADTPVPKQGNTFSMYVAGGTHSELKTVFDKLAEGADKDQNTFMELHDMPFGTYGQLTDKYGVSWIFVGEKNNK